MRLLMILSLFLTAVGCDHEVHEARTPIQTVYSTAIIRSAASAASSLPDRMTIDRQCLLTPSPSGRGLG